jgi:hypothetical protein
MQPWQVKSVSVFVDLSALFYTCLKVVTDICEVLSGPFSFFVSQLALMGIPVVKGRGGGAESTLTQQ